MVNLNWHMKVLAVVLLLLSPAAAQSSLELVGFGLANSSSDVVSRGMGGISSVPPGANQWLSTAPASWYRIRGTQLQAALETAEAHLSGSESLSNTRLENIQFLIFVNQRTSYSIGIQPVTRASMALRDTTGVDTLDEEIRYAHDQSFDGGISAFKLGFSKRIGTSVSIGANLDILFGVLTRHDDLQFLDKGSREEYLVDGFSSERRLEFNGQRLELGFLTSVPPRTKGELGINAIIPLRLKVIEEIIELQANNSLFEPNRFTYKDVGTQAEITIGYSVDVAEQYRILTEVELSRLVEEESNDLLFGRVLEGTRSFRVGWTRNPGEEELLSIGRLYYRVGFSRTDYYLSSLKNTSLTEFAFSVGVGSQSPRYGSRFDCAIQIGRRDGLLGKVQTEDFWRISVGVITTELWFARPDKKWD